jgi:septum formation protein
MLILASASPRRHSLLSATGLPLTVAPRPCEEDFDTTTPLIEVPALLAARKAATYPQADIPEGTCVISADTVVIADGQILNKPATETEARYMLNLLSDAEHQVVTGIALRTKTIQRIFSESSTVRFYPIPERVIERYIASGACFDKAGAYGIQDYLGIIACKSITGSYDNIVGLPVARLLQELELIGYRTHSY